jgi:hypothetical protein
MSNSKLDATFHPLAPPPDDDIPLDVHPAHLPDNLPEAVLRQIAAAADLPRSTLLRVLTPEQATELVGGKVPALDATPALNEGGLWTDRETGEPVLALFPCPEPAALRRAILASQPAFGMGTLRSGSGNRNMSVTFGYRPRKPMMSQEGCVLTAFNRDYPDVASFLSHYSGVLAAQLGTAFPEIEVMGREVLEQVKPDWRLSDDSLWTSGVINKESALPYHRDGNNFDAWSVMPVIRRGVRGGHLHIPEYDIVIPCRDGYTVAFFGRRLVHGVTPMRKVARDGYRISVVYYALQGLKDCHTFAEETAYARKRRTLREDTLGEGQVNIERILNKETRPAPGSAARFGTGPRSGRGPAMTEEQS